MSDLSLNIPSGRTVFLEYERDRRRRLTEIIAPLIAVLAIISVVMYTIFIAVLSISHQPVPVIAVPLDLTIAGLALFLGLSTMAVRRGLVNLAAAGTAATITLTILIIQGVWVMNLGIDPYVLILFTALDFVIVLIGVLGDTRTILTATILVSLETAMLWAFAPRNPDMAAIINREFALIAPASIMVYWGMAILQIAVQRATRATLDELGAVRLAYERAQKLDELKDQFISSVNHELRTPLSAMLGFLEILDLSVERASPERLHVIIKDANEAGEDLHHLVDSILETRRLDQGAANFDPECVVVDEVIQKAVRLIDPRESKQIERDLILRIPSGFAIWGERIRLQQILINLLSNAIKYSADGTPVEISAQVVNETVSVAERHGRKTTHERAMAEIIVRDYGLGVPADAVPLLFQRFVRLPRDLASTVIGNGLGLYLCRVFAEAMGGRIWVESSGVEGAGSAFHIRLPLPPVAPVPTLS